MEDSVDAEVNSTNNLNSPEIMEITPVLDDFLTPELMLGKSCVTRRDVYTFPTCYKYFCLL